MNKKFISIKILKKSHLTLPSLSYKNEDSPTFQQTVEKGKQAHKGKHISPHPLLCGWGVVRALSALPDSLCVRILSSMPIKQEHHVPQTAKERR